MKTNKFLLALLIFLLILSSFGAYADQSGIEAVKTPFMDVMANSELNSSAEAVNPDIPATALPYTAGSLSPYAFSRIQRADTTLVEDEGAVYFYRDGDKYNTKMYHVLDFTGMTGKVVLDWAGRTTTTGVQYRTFYAINSNSVSNNGGATLRPGIGGPTAMTRWTLIFDLDNDTISYYENGEPASPGTEFPEGEELTGFALLHYLQGAESASKMGGVDYVRIYNIPGSEAVNLENSGSTELSQAILQFALPVKEDSVVIDGDNVVAAEKSADLINGYNISLKNLTFEQEYSITVSAASIDGTPIEQTLTAKTRPARSKTEILGIYDGAYSPDSEPIDSLSDIVVSAALRVENELPGDFEAYMGFAVYDASGNMVAFDDADVCVDGGTPEEIVEIPLDLSEIPGIGSCTYTVFLWDSKDAMNTYGTNAEISDSFAVESSVDVNSAQKNLTLTASGYDETHAGTPLSVKVILNESEEVYLNQISVTDGELTSLVIPLAKSGVYTVYANSPLLSDVFKSEHRILLDSDAETILKNINNASDGDAIYKEIENNSLDEIFAFAPYDALKALDSKACKEVCSLVYNAKEKEQFSGMSDFYNAVFEASIVHSFVSDVPEAALAGYAQDYDSVIGFSLYNAYQTFIDADADFQSAVVKRARNESITDAEALSHALGAAVVNELIFTADSYLQINDYLTDNNDLLGFDLSDYKTVKSDVCRELVNKDFDTYAELEDAFEEAVEDALDEKSSSGKKGSSGGGGGGKSSGGLVVVANPEVQTKPEETVTSPADTNNEPKEYFGDLCGYEWAKLYIDSLYEKGIVGGKAEGVFAPGDMITRAEFTKLFSEAFDIAKAEYDGFSDVAKSDWYYAYVGGAYANGIIKGLSDGLFGANDPITRQDAAVILWRISGKPESVGSITFADSERISDYAADAVMALAELKIINGNDAGEFLPLSNLNRAEAAKLIYLLMETEGK